MDSEGQTASNYHVLLIGIDDYPGHELNGCVNDIDAVQRVLLDRMAIPGTQIRRLASPRPGTTHDTTVGEAPATLDNLRKALVDLASDRVKDGDRVFIYYSGHGKRVDLPAGNGRVFHREALVPVDFSSDPQADKFLFDFEVNALLAAIVNQTRSVTVMLDCCHASGATRGVGLRTFLGQRTVGSSATRGDPVIGDDPARRGMCEGIDACQVISACLDNEFAREDTYDGAHNGLLTRGFVTALAAAKDADLHALTWAQIWQPVLATMASRSAPQHPEMAGNQARLVFSGPPVDGDAGIPVTYDAAGDDYRIGAGTMADITEGAVLAIYGREPRRFAPRGSDEDRAARIALLRVTSAGLAAATAIAITPEGAIMSGQALPAGARARLIKAGVTARLRYAVTPNHPEIAIDSPLLEQAAAGEAAPVGLELRGDRWRLTDDEHTTEDGAAVLCELRPGQLGLARDVLEHYYAYSLPLRLAHRATPDRKGDLQLSVLCCPDENLTPENAQAADLREATPGNGRYELRTGAKVCFRVSNTGDQPLRVTLLNAAASGRVQWLGDRTINAGAQHVFWYENTLGQPFAMSPARTEPRGIDRLVAIGRTDANIELKHLAFERKFADIVAPTRDAGDARKRDMQPSSAASLDRWTAAIAVIDTRDAARSVRDTAAAAARGTRGG